MFVKLARLSRSQSTIKEVRRCQRREKLVELFLCRLLLCGAVVKKKVLGGQNSLKPLRRHAATSLQRQRRRSQSIYFFISVYHFHYFHFQFCVLSIKIYQRIYSRKSDNNSVTRGKARFIYLQLQLHCNLSRVRRLPQGSLLHEPVTKFQTIFCFDKVSSQLLLRPISNYLFLR